MEEEIETPVSATCACNGIRFCNRCINSERVKHLFSGNVPLRNADNVISNQTSTDRTSSLSFAMLGNSQKSVCIDCGAVYNSTIPITCCADHKDKNDALTDASVKGLFVVRDVVSEPEETALVHFFDHPSPFPEWKNSQSGRRKQDYGPKRNFKKKKVKPADYPHMPKLFDSLFRKVSEAVMQCTANVPYTIVQVSVLEYTADNMSNFDPHVDDTWIWGSRVSGVNLLEDCVMTFVDSTGSVVDAFLPRRCLFLMSGDCRYVWMHGIRPENVKGRRVSITMRELSDEIKTEPNVAMPIVEAAKSFV